MVAIQIHDTSSSRPSGRTWYPAPEFLEFKEQSHVFEEVIGGTGDDTPAPTKIARVSSANHECQLLLYPAAF